MKFKVRITEEVTEVFEGPIEAESTEAAAELGLELWLVHGITHRGFKLVSQVVDEREVEVSRMESGKRK